MCASVTCEYVLLQGEPGPSGPPGGPGEDGERVSEKLQFHTCLLCFLQHFLCFCISLSCVTELRLQSHLSHLLIIIIGKSRASVFNSVLTYWPFEQLVEFHSHHSLSQSVLSLLFFPPIISLSSPLYPQPMQPDPLSLLLLLLPAFPSSLKPRSADTHRSLTSPSIVIHSTLWPVLSLSQGDDGEIGPRGLPGEPVSDHLYYHLASHWQIVG